MFNFIRNLFTPAHSGTSNTTNGKAVKNCDHEWEIKKEQEVDGTEIITEGDDVYAKTWYEKTKTCRKCHYNSSAFYTDKRLLESELVAEKTKFNPFD